MNCSLDRPISRGAILLPQTLEIAINTKLETFARLYVFFRQELPTLSQIECLELAERLLKLPEIDAALN
jgi:hypothetical protein